MLAEKLLKPPSAVANYIEDVFSTYLYTGNGSTQTITNGINLAGKGGLVWTKSRNNGGSNNSHNWVDTVRGVSKRVVSEGNNAQQSYPGYLTSAFNGNGFDVTDNSAGLYSCNGSSGTYASWTFRKQAKFFDVVTYTGTGSNRTVAHSLGSTPGCIIVKRTDTVGDWQVYHNGLTSAAYSIQLDLTNAQASATTVWNSTAPTSTVFSVGTSTDVNANAGTYVAYLFAHNAGGFGLTGTDNVISCGSYTTDSSGKATVTLGYEPQWFMYKSSSSTGSWAMYDNIRGMTVGGNDPALIANSSGAEVTGYNEVDPSATGFSVQGLNSSTTYIYIVIRRGPMKVPTDATKVFAPVFASSSGPFTATTGFPVDLDFYGQKGSTNKWFWFDRLRGNPLLQSNNTNAEAASVGAFDSNTSFYLSGTSGNYSDFINYAMRRAPNFFDEVCYTGTGSALAVTHNLAATPELVIIKKRSAISNWPVGVSFTPTGSKVGYLNDTADLGTAAYSSGGFFSTQRTSTTFTVGTDTSVGASGATYVAYLFASCTGVSKVGSYTGNGTNQTIDCGFPAGARFVLIKVTSTTGGWYVYDTARGMTTLTDPYLFLNSTAAEAATLGSVTTVSTGFKVDASILAAVNTNTATYLYLAIA